MRFFSHIGLLLAVALVMASCARVENSAGDVSLFGEFPFTGSNTSGPPTPPAGTGTGEPFGGREKARTIPSNIGSTNPSYSYFFGGLYKNAGVSTISSNRLVPQTMGSGDFTVVFLLRISGEQTDLTSPTNVLVGKTDLAPNLPLNHPFLCVFNNSTAGALAGKVSCSQKVNRLGNQVVRSLTSPQRIDEGEEHFVVFSRTQNTLLLTIDGVSVASEQFTPGLNDNPTNSSPIQIGGIGTSQIFKGEIGYIAVYDRSFSNSLIQELYDRILEDR